METQSYAAKKQSYSLMKSALMIFLCFAMPSYADEYCQRPNKIDLEYPAGILGHYEIIGRLPSNSMAYSGRLEIKEGETAYVLKRTVDGKTTIGEAWIEFCSPDRFPVFTFKYTKMSKPFAGICFFTGDSSNYLLISCYTHFIGKKKKHKQRGLESMFQLR